MDLVKLPAPVETEVIRTPAAGPDPLNTLAFVRCAGGGADVATNRVDTLYRYRVHFLSKFRIDGFAQANIDWYRANTLVSATAFVRLYNETEDTNFVCAVDAIVPFIDLDGSLGFEVDLAQLCGGPALFGVTPEISFGFNVSAYVLLFEPRVELPKPGKFRRNPYSELRPSPPWQPVAESKLRAVTASDTARIRLTPVPREAGTMREPC
jgi:hypothetical protein